MNNPSFKAYNTKEKCWIGPIELFTFLCVRDGDTGEAVPYPGNVKSSLKFVLPAHIILVLSTGLKSATGEELWMGDICSQELQNDFGSVSKMIGILWWFEKGGCFSIRYSTELPMMGGGSATAPVRLGNIFDNPEAIPKDIPSFINFTPPVEDSKI